MKRVWIALVVIIICSCLYIVYDNNISNITYLSKYKPFDSEYKNVYIDTIKISSNLPKIDVATTFYPLASSIVQSIYDEKSYNNELSYDSTSTAYKNLLDGKVDIIIVTSPSENQQKMKKNTDLINNIYVNLMNLNSLDFYYVFLLY